MTMPKMLSVAALCLAVAGSVPAVMAADTGSHHADKKVQAASLSKKDLKFATLAYQGNLSEIQVGQLASTKARNSEVQKLAATIVADHESANAKLSTLLTNKGATLPTEQKEKHKDHYEELSKLDGSKFDKEYLSMMISDHKKDVSEYEDAAKNSDDADLRNYAVTTLPVIQKHLTMAQNLYKSVK